MSSPVRVLQQRWFHMKHVTLCQPPGQKVKAEFVFTGAQVNDASIEFGLRLVWFSEAFSLQAITIATVHVLSGG